MNFELILLPRVIYDLEEVFYWYQEQSDGLGYDMEDEFYQRLSDVRKHPLGVQVRYKNMRVAWLERFPYGIHFYCQENSIIVTALIHTSRSPKVGLTG